MTAPVAVTSTSRVRFPELSIVLDGDEYVVGDPATGQFVSLPPIGVTAIRALDADQTVGEATAEVSAAAGEHVNLVEFVETMIECGLVDSIDGRAVRTVQEHTKQPWWKAVRPERARLFFGRTAWTIYLVATVWAVVALVSFPGYRPAFEDYLFFPNPAISLAFFFVFTLMMAMIHEYWHWLGARALGVDAAITVSRRAFFIVLQTDLGRLWSLPRRRRLGPLAAGMAFDATVLGAALAFRVVNGQIGLLPPLADRFLAALVLSQCMVLVFQMLICLRTDGYLLVSTVLGCRDLRETTKLYVRSVLLRLTPEQAAKLADAPVRDRQVAKWYGPVFVAVVAFVVYWFVNFWLPGVVLSSGWMLYGLLGAPVLSVAFVQAAIPATLLLVEIIVPIYVAIRDRVRARGTRWENAT
jgi:putative peptide zinc metalloprotease protein